MVNTWQGEGTIDVAGRLTPLSDDPKPIDIEKTVARFKELTAERDMKVNIENADSQHRE